MVIHRRRESPAGQLLELADEAAAGVVEAGALDPEDDPEDEPEPESDDEPDDEDELEPEEDESDELELDPEDESEEEELEPSDFDEPAAGVALLFLSRESLR
jgi:hypothetical protein